MKLNTQKDFNLFKEELLIAIYDFLYNKRSSNSVFFKELQFTYEKILPLLNKRFVRMENDFCFDKNVNGCWLGLFGHYCPETFEYDLLLKDVLNKIKACYKNTNIDLPTKNELLNLTDIKDAIFPTINNRPSVGAYLLYRYENPKNLKQYIRSLSMSRLPVKSLADIQGLAIPLYRLYNSDTELENKYIFMLWIIHKLKPFGLKDDFYDTLLQFDITQNDLKIKVKETSSDVIGIDFGSFYTIITKEETPLSIGFDIETGVDFYNPTIMEFDNQDIYVSHIAYKHYKKFDIEKYHRFIKELKPWVEGKKRRVTIIHYNKEIEIPRYEKSDIDLLEIYAFHLAKQINKIKIFSEYVISLPIKTPKLENKIINSFKTGISKAINKDIVIKGIYATTAYLLKMLEDNNFKSKTLYSVFDFGAGSAEYEIGIFDSLNEMRYDYSIKRLECGNVGIGYEDLLEFLVYEIMELNKDLFFKHKIFDYFIQKLNKEIITEKVREFLFENDVTILEDMKLFNYKKEKIKLELEFPDFDDFFKTHYEIIINDFVKKLERYSKEKYLFLNGEVTKSEIFQNLLKKRIDGLGIKLFLPLDKSYTACGLTLARQGGRYKIENIEFNYILGINKNNKFLPIITENTPFNKWIKFIDGSEEFFELYYLLVPLDKNSIVKRKKLKIDKTDRDAFICIKTIDKTAIEYALIKNNKFISEIYKVDLEMD